MLFSVSFQMLSILFIIAAVQVVVASSAPHNKLANLVVAARVTRGYLPEPMESRKRLISTTVDSLTRHSAELRNAIKARLDGSYTFLSLLRPIIPLYAELSALYFFPGTKTAGLNERLHTALHNQLMGVPIILSNVKQAFAVLPEWTVEINAQYDDLARGLVMQVRDLHALLNTLSRKQNLKVIYLVRAQLLMSLMDPIMNLVEKIEVSAMNREVSGRSPRELLNVMHDSITSNTEVTHLWRWSTRHLAHQGVAEINVLTGENKKRNELIKSLYNCVFSKALQLDYSSLTPKCPTVVWRAGTYPGDKELLDISLATVARGRVVAAEQDREMANWISFVSNLFLKSFKLNLQDKLTLSRLGAEFHRHSEARIDVERDIIARRKDLIARGLEYLK